MKLEQLEIIFNSLQGEVNTLKNENLLLKQRLETLEKQGINLNSNPVDNLSLNVSINERIANRVVKELDFRLPELVGNELRKSMPDYVSPLQFNSFKASMSNQYIDMKTFETREKEISNRISILETKKVKRFSFLTINRTTNEYYKDEVEKKLFEKYGGWLKFKKDWIWGFIVTLIIMSSIITIQWFQIHNLEDRLNPKELVTASQIKEKQ